MTANPTQPDELDRLFAILVRTVRDQKPEYLAKRFEVSELLGFVPYKTVRVDIGADTNDDYGHTVTRLLSGERGLMFVDDLMQDDLTAELKSKNPDLQAYRSYLNSYVKLAQERVRAVLEASWPAAQTVVAPADETPDPAATLSTEPTPPSLADLVAGPVVDPLAAFVIPVAATAAAPVVAAPVVEAPPALPAPAPPPPPPPPSPSPPPPPPPPPPSPPVRAPLAAPASTSAPVRSAPAATTREGPGLVRPRRVPDATAAVAPGVDVRSARPGCKYCGQPLPQGREVKFCPHCGQDLSVHRCAACSAELEPGWKFCVACGRAASR